MPLSLEQAKNEMYDAEKKLSQYSSDLPAQIKAEYDKAWSPVLENAVGVTQDMRQNFLPQFFNTPFLGAGGGNTAADYSPEFKLQQLGSSLGELGGRLEGSQRVADYLGGQMRDLYNQSIGLYETDLGAAQSAYDRATQRYQLAQQAAEAAAARQQQIDLANQMRAQQALAEQQAKQAAMQYSVDAAKKAVGAGGAAIKKQYSGNVNSIKQLLKNPILSKMAHGYALQPQNIIASQMLSPALQSLRALGLF